MTTRNEKNASMLFAGNNFEAASVSSKLARNQKKGNIMRKLDA